VRFESPREASLESMEWGDGGKALRALAGHAQDGTLDAARRSAPADEQALHCERCNATWFSEALEERGVRRSECLLCGGPLVPTPAD
jgi:hypothetical protein